jgi:hypothetical protein
VIKDLATLQEGQSGKVRSRAILFVLKRSIVLQLGVRVL